MASSGVPASWPPYMNTRDCSQGFCSFYCPQWCYVVVSPPPPSHFPQERSGFHFSPLIIAIVGSLASAFLLVTYYTLLSKYCGRTNQTTRANHEHSAGYARNHSPSSIHEPWHVSSTGLDEALIRSITICKYKKGNGLIEGTCSVCLSEFNEDESIRLLPICSHAFHISCIDTWLRSHSNCPLCRSSIIPIHASQLESFPLQTESRLPRRDHVSANTANVEIMDRNSGNVEGMHDDAQPVKSPSRALGDLGSSQRRDTIIDIREEGRRNIGRSVSMDHSCQTHVSVADILKMNEDEDAQVADGRLLGSAGPSKQATVEGSKICNKKDGIHTVTNPIAVKRSFSSGKLFFLNRQERTHNAIIPF